MFHVKRLAVPIIVLSLAACTQAQIETAQGYQDKIAGACAMAMTIAPLTGSVAPWIVGGCATEADIARLALDPTSFVWLRGLVVSVPRSR